MGTSEVKYQLVLYNGWTYNTRWGGGGRGGRLQWISRASIWVEKILANHFTITIISIGARKCLSIIDSASIVWAKENTWTEAMVRSTMYRSWKKFTVRYFRVKFVCGKIFSPLDSPMNKSITFLFIVKNISLVQFSSYHTSDEKILASNFSQTTVYQAMVRDTMYIKLW